jgi:hypothetical protein
VNGEHKITSSHRQRAALIYLRQSSMVQVREHAESTRSQLLAAIHREHRWMGRVINGERGVLLGFGLRWAGARRHVGDVGMRPALPVTFGEARGGP